MKVLFQTRSDALDRLGGDTIQMQNTAKELRKLGVEVDFSSDFHQDLFAYDIVHIFQLQWAAEPYLLAANAKRQHKPLVVSPIHHSETEVKRWEESEKYDFKRIQNVLLKNQEHRDITKNLYRAIIDRKFAKLYPTLLSIKEGYRNQQKKVLEMADLVLVQTNLEAEDIKKDYKAEFRWQKIVNGVGEGFLTNAYHRWIEIDDYIVTVGRVESRKNQLRIIDACQKFRDEEKRDIKLVIIGGFNKHNIEYCIRFKNKIAKLEWVKHYEKIEYSDMPSVYRQAKVCVSASWLETSGLTSLEALFSNCNVVASGERAKEYLADFAQYCDPASVSSIKEAIAEAYFSPRPQIPDEMKNLYTWEEVARETLKVYNKILGR